MGVWQAGRGSGWREEPRSWGSREGSPRTKASMQVMVSGLILSKNEDSARLPCHVNDKQ